MSITFDEALLYPTSRKIVYVTFTFIKELYNWTATTVTDGTSVITAYSIPTIEPTLDISELPSADDDIITMTKVNTESELALFDTTDNGAWFEDTNNSLIYIRTKDIIGDTAFTNFYVSHVEFRMAEAFEIDDEGNLYEPKIIDNPSISLKTSDLFKGVLAMLGSGGITITNTDGFMSRRDIEVDGEVTIQAALEIPGVI